jgi:hypothetical protein
MSLISTRPIQGPCAWRGADLAGDDTWIHVLSGTAIDEIDRALATVKSRGLHFPDFAAADFPLPLLAADLARHADELENGRGFLLLRGLPVERYTDDEIHIVYYGIGLHLGLPVRQNPRGDLLGVVMTWRATPSSSGCSTGRCTSRTCASRNPASRRSSASTSAS